MAMEISATIMRKKTNTVTEKCNSFPRIPVKPQRNTIK
jgi:hypothetical protein